jgi:lambda family phage minor tail protein L
MRNDADYGLIMSGRQSAFTDDFNLAPLFSEETNKPTQNKLFHLITLILPDPEPNFCIVDSNYDIKFSDYTTGLPITYTRFPVKFSGAELNSDGSISKASIAVANVSREIMDYVEKYNGLRNCRVYIKTVYENALDEIYTPQPDGSVIVEPNTAVNNTAFIEDEYLIDTYTATEQAVVFQLDPIIDLEIRLPRRRYMTDSCYFLYKDPETCKYSGALPTCDKTLAACREHKKIINGKEVGNERNFGGFPGVSASRRLFI